MNHITKDLGSDLSLYYAVLLAVWPSFGYHAFVPAHIPVNDFFGSRMMFVGVPFVESVIRMFSNSYGKIRE